MGSRNIQRKAAAQGFCGIRNKRRMAVIMDKSAFFSAAYRLLKTMLWNGMTDDQIFALRLSTGEIGYVSILSGMDEYNAVMLYRGEDAYRTAADQLFRRDMAVSPFHSQEMVLKQDCLQAAFMSWKDMTDADLEIAEQCAAKVGLTALKEEDFPQMVRCVPFCQPRPVTDETEAGLLIEALEVAAAIGEYTEDPAVVEAMIPMVDEDTREIPLLSCAGGKLKIEGSIPAPDVSKTDYRDIPAENQLIMRKLARLPKLGVWETELIRMCVPVQNEPLPEDDILPEETHVMRNLIPERAPVTEESIASGEIPEMPDDLYYPLMLLPVDSATMALVDVPVIMNADEEPEKLVQAFCLAVEQYHSCPREIHCRDERTFHLLKDFCEQLGIVISIDPGEMASLSRVEEMILAKFGFLPPESE